MTYVSAEARQELLDYLADAVDEIAVGLAAVGGAYELLDERSGEALEERLFGPLQKAYSRARRAHSGFAERHNLPTREFEQAHDGLPSTGVAGFVEMAADAVRDAEAVLVELQDSMLPVEVGDAEVRAGIGEVRELIAPLPNAAREFMRTRGR